MDFKMFMSQWYVRALMILALTGLVASFSAYTYLTFKSAQYNFMGPTTINVRGEGEVFAKPDIGSFTFSVRAEGKEAAEAQNKSAESMNAVLAYLKEAGVEEKDIKTTNYSLNPTYSPYDDTWCYRSNESDKGANGTFDFVPMTTPIYQPYDPCPYKDPVIDGYEVYQMVQVKVRNLDKSGDLISGVGSKGATDISGLSFTIDDETGLKAQAREKAIAQAKEKATKLADDLGVRIVRMVGFYEEEGYPMPYYGGYGAEMSMSKDAMNVAPGMPTGENTITATVNITYEIK